MVRGQPGWPGDHPPTQFSAEIRREFHIHADFMCLYPICHSNGLSKAIKRQMNIFGCRWNVDWRTYSFCSKLKRVKGIQLPWMCSSFCSKIGQKVIWKGWGKYSGYNVGMYTTTCTCQNLSIPGFSPFSFCQLKVTVEAEPAKLQSVQCKFSSTVFHVVCTGFAVSAFGSCNTSQIYIVSTAIVKACSCISAIFSIHSSFVECDEVGRSELV